jgi:hypothetical protein
MAPPWPGSWRCCRGTAAPGCRDCGRRPSSQPLLLGPADHCRLLPTVKTERNLLMAPGSRVTGPSWRASSPQSRLRRPGTAPFAHQREGACGWCGLTTTLGTISMLPIRSRPPPVPGPRRMRPAPGSAEDSLRRPGPHPSPLRTPPTHRAPRRDARPLPQETVLCAVPARVPGDEAGPSRSPL